MTTSIPSIPDAQMTPMMEQYLRAKKRFPEAILFFRMGDFYEMFFEDARTASAVLGIALTSRSKGENAVPMAGVPYHAADAYIKKLIDAGCRVAICDQVEDPKKTKKLVEREVTRVVTPGTLTEESILDANRENFLAAVFRTEGPRCGLAWVDLSTGSFSLHEVPPDHLLQELCRLSPSECLLPEEEFAGAFPGRVREAVACQVARHPGWTFDAANAARALREHFGVASLEGFGCPDTGPGIQAAGAVIQYLRETQRTSLAHIRALTPYRPEGFLLMDGGTQRNLELLQTSRAMTLEGSLLWVLDQTVTPMGTRRLRHWITNPLRDPAAVTVRQDAVAELVPADRPRRDLRAVLADVRDVERIAARISCGRASPRDLGALRDSAEALPRLAALASAFHSGILAALGRMDCLDDIAGRLRRALVDAPPPHLRDGGVIRHGYHEELDRLRGASTRGKGWLAELQKRETERTGIPTLKIGFNKVFGYYIEVTNAHRGKVPQDYTRKQTLKNAERYVTPELKEYESTVLTAEERSLELEAEIFRGLQEEAARHTGRIQRAADAVADADVLAALAEVARKNHYTRPEVNDGSEIRIEDGRHPVLDRMLAQDAFVPNDLALDDDARIVILTGPNMAGKSTYIRQAALIVILAQMGGFVPARKAVIGAVDRIFTRIGAGDELARGQSTFMVEMIETANILNNATDRSLIILDEVGRGTSTFDGVSIAWAVTEYIHRHLGARTLFATHYHELTDLATTLPGVRNANVAVREWNDQVVFLHKIVEGAADKSYGIHVAQLAGVPQEVLARARTILTNLEVGSVDGQQQPRFLPEEERAPKGPVQLSLLRTPAEDIADALRSCDLDTLTPLEAINKLAEMKKRLEEGPP